MFRKFNALGLMFILGIKAGHAMTSDEETLKEKGETIKIEFQRDLKANPSFKADLYDINQHIKEDSAFEKDRRPLSVAQAWAAVREKAFNPVKYIPHAVRKGIVLKDTVWENKGYSSFIRISVQKPFKKAKESDLSVVREEVFINESEKKVYFMGRPALDSDYTILGVKKSDAYSQPLFHVLHQIKIEGEQPFDSWTFVSLPSIGWTRDDQNTLVKSVKEGKKKPHRIYLKAQEKMSSEKGV